MKIQIGIVTYGGDVGIGVGHAEIGKHIGCYYTIDWGDGTKEIRNTDLIFHDYAASKRRKKYIIRIECKNPNPETFTRLFLFFISSPYDDLYLSDLHISEWTMLEHLDLPMEPTWLKTLDLTKNTRLKSLSGMCDYLTTLDLSHNTELENLELFCDDLEMLDISGCHNLEYMQVVGHSLQEIRVNKDAPLKEVDLHCYGSQDMKGADQLIESVKKNKGTLDLIYNGKRIETNGE